MNTAPRALLLALGLLSGAPFAAAQSAAPAAEFRITGAERVVAIADIHGAYEAFISLLQGTGLVDAELRWTGAAAHLVIVGDILDRGERSREVLDLVMRLEQEAPAAGGAVHMVLGNHEIMNMTGELGYVSRAEFEAYRDVENTGMRRDAQDRFGEEARGLSTLQLRTAFTRQYPRGYFGHRSAFAPDGIYGSWLLKQPVLLVIDDTAFVHAGLSAALLQSDVTTVNRDAGSALADYLAGMKVLIDAEVLHPETDFLKHPALLDAYLGSARTRNPAISAAAEALTALRQREPFGPASTVWYRGMIDCSPAVEYDRVQQALNKLGVQRLVIGHTPTRDHLVQQRLDNTLVMADTGMLADYYGGQPAAVIIEGESVKVFYADSGATAEPSPQPRVVGARSVDVGDDELEALLLEANSPSGQNLPDGRSALSLQHGTQTLEAIFSPAVEPGFIPEVAAYRLDRLLQLDLVPVAVAHDLGGVTGAVYIDDAALPAIDALTTANRNEAWCPLDDQLAVMQVFDALLGQGARSPAQQRFTSGNWKLALTGNRQILAADAAAPNPADLYISAFLRTKLSALNESVLAAELGDVLDAPRRAALLQRRDLLLNAGQ